MIKKPEIFLWGLCNSYGTSWLCAQKPKRQEKSDLWELGEDVLILKKKNLFPTDKPIKLKLTIKGFPQVHN